MCLTIVAHIHTDVVNECFPIGSCRRVVVLASIVEQLVVNIDAELRLF